MGVDNCCCAQRNPKDKVEVDNLFRPVSQPRNSKLTNQEGFFDELVLESIRSQVSHEQDTYAYFQN